MPDLHLIAADGERIELTNYDAGEPGILVLSGVTGVGMPKVDTRWLEGAGHGALYRGTRVQPRDIDLPLYVDGRTRAGLKEQMKRLSLALAGPVRLEWTDDDETWILEDCVRVGGGEYTYGTHTDGERDLLVIVTLRAGQPFWRRSTKSSWGLTPGTNVVEMIGSAPTPPTWTITGPATHFAATAPDGKSIGWTGTLLADQVLTIDVQTGTATSAAGDHYSELDTAPKFWQLSPGSTTVEIEFDGTGSVFVEWYPRDWLVI